MNISSLSSSTVTSTVAGISGTSGSGGVQATQRSAQCPTGDQTGISRMGEFMQKLDELASSDPEKFQEVTSQIADELETLERSTGGDESSMLSEIADKFRAASESGSADELKPKGPPSGGAMGGPPPQGAQAYARQVENASSTTGTDMRSEIDSILERALGGS